MIIRVEKTEYNTDRVPVLVFWKNQKAKQLFVQEMVNIKTFKTFTTIEGFSFIKVEDSVINSDAKVAIKFNDREEKSSLLRHLYELGSDCNMYVACPDDIPYNIIFNWINTSLKDMEIKPDTTIEITD